MWRGLAVAALSIAGLAECATALEPTGRWWAEGGAGQVEIRQCDEALCGRIVWLRSPFDVDGCPLRDRENPDPELRDRELIGAEILSGLRREGGEDDRWSGGAVYDPDSGRTYRATMTLHSPDRLEMRGYIGFRFLGRSTTWIRVGTEGQCRHLPTAAATAEAALASRTDDGRR